MAVTSAAAAAAAALLTAASSIKQGRDAKKQADQQANITNEQAANARQIAGLSERDFRKRQSQALGEFIAASGTSGVTGTGSSLLASEDFLAETELQALRIRKGGQVQASRLEQQADLFRSAGRSARTTGYARGGASLLSGFAKFNE